MVRTPMVSLSQFLKIDFSGSSRVIFGFCPYKSYFKYAGSPFLAAFYGSNSTSTWPTSPAGLPNAATYHNQLYNGISTTKPYMVAIYDDTALKISVSPINYIDVRYAAFNTAGGVGTRAPQWPTTDLTPNAKFDIFHMFNRSATSSTKTYLFSKFR
jgi:hypothetical protein